MDKSIRIKDKRGFTLMELLVVIVILSILATFVGYNFMGKTEDAKKTQAKTQIKSIENALKLYKLDNGEFPSTEQGLHALIEKPTVGTIPKNWKEGGYLDGSKVPQDPWANDYSYQNPGTHNTNGVDIFSYGPDGPDSADQAAIIGNWEAEAGAEGEK